MMRIVRRIAVGLLTLIVVSLVFGAIYQRTATAGAFDNYLPPGRFFAVGDHNLHITCSGSGRSVVLESGFGGWSIDWRGIQPEIARFARVCSYDRSGLGWSERGPASTTTRQGRARELHALLRRASVPKPYVLVGHSLGGFFIREFARLYPKDVAGLVFVDSSHEEMGSRLTKQERDEAVGQLRLLRFGRYLMPFGIQRLLGLPVSNARDLPEDVRDEAEAIGYRSSSYFALYDEASNLIREEDEGSLKLGKIPNVPLTVLASDENVRDIAVWKELQEELAGLTRDARFEIVAHSGHFIHVDQPEIVVSAIRHVLLRAKVRA
ncbi:MAG TPA: alpha/beta hydrolase [Actinomycetota bacterium]|nr:alpha/beta hydrolase [Actinomycetota bacterium]